MSIHTSHVTSFSLAVRVDASSKVDMSTLLMCHLQVTPTIFGTEDFVPRKGVMTRYAKKMVRPDMYGLVVVRGLLGEAGATA